MLNGIEVDMKELVSLSAAEARSIAKTLLKQADELDAKAKLERVFIQSTSVKPIPHPRMVRVDQHTTNEMWYPPHMPTFEVHIVALVCDAGMPKLFEGLRKIDPELPKEMQVKL